MGSERFKRPLPPRSLPHFPQTVLNVFSTLRFLLRPRVVTKPSIRPPARALQRPRAPSRTEPAPSKYLGAEPRIAQPGLWDPDLPGPRPGSTSVGRAARSRPTVSRLPRRPGRAGPSWASFISSPAERASAGANNVASSPALLPPKLPLANAAPRRGGLGGRAAAGQVGRPRAGCPAPAPARPPRPGLEATSPAAE